MLDNRHPALNSLPRVGYCFLVSALGSTEALQAHLEARLVHHGEHAGEALIFLTDQVTDRTAVVTVGHDTGGAAVDTELMFDRDGVGIVALAQ